MVGKLQTNKAKKAIELFDFIHSLDSSKLGDILKKRETELKKKLSYFIQINIGDEPQKGRYRFFHQWDIEIFGRANFEYDAEIIEFTSKFFSKLDLQNIVIDISHRKLVQSYINKIFESDDSKIVSDMLRAVDKIQKKSKQDIIA